MCRDHTNVNQGVCESLESIEQPISVKPNRRLRVRISIQTHPVNMVVGAGRGRRCGLGQMSGALARGWRGLNYWITPCKIGGKQVDKMKRPFYRKDAENAKKSLRGGGVSFVYFVVGIRK